MNDPRRTDPRRAGTAIPGWNANPAPDTWTPETASSPAAWPEEPAGAMPGWDAGRQASVAGGSQWRADDTPEPEVETIVAEIEQTRDEMSETVAAIGQKLDPANIAQGARDAAVGKVEQTVRSVQNAAEDFVAQPVTTVQEAGGGLLDTIRANPVPAALAGIGIGWLWMSRSGNRDRERYGAYGASGWDSGYGGAWSSGSRASRGVPSGSQGIAGQAGDAVRGAGRTVGQTMGGVTESVGQAADDVGQTVGQVGETVGRTVGQVPMQAQGLARQVGDAMSRNPLGFGAVALAVGTAVGLALPATAAERRVLGDASSTLIDEAERAAREGMEQLRETTGS